MELAERLSQVKPSATLAISAKAKAMKAEGIDVVGFGAGEPDFDTPDHIKEAAIKAINDGFTKYTPAGGTDELKDSIIERAKKDYDLDYNRSQVLVSCGAKHTLYNFFQAACQKGDQVIITAPYWLTYPAQVLLADAEPVIINTTEENGFRVTPEQLEASITPRTRVLVLNSPSNPTGAAYSAGELEKIAEIIVKHDLMVVSDEIYDKLVYDDYSHISIACINEEVKKRTILVNGVSKTYSMTGWRIGYALGDKDVIGGMSRIQSQSTSNPTSISQAASVAALSGPQDCIDEMKKAFDERRRYIVDRLNKIPGISCFMPKGAFYSFPNVSSYYGKSFEDTEIKSSLDMAAYLLKNALVAVVPGEPFGADNYIRLSYATSMDNIVEGLNRIEESLKKL